MTNHSAINTDEYIFCFEKKYKGQFFYEAKARSIKKGKMYDVRFEGKKHFTFYIYERYVWKIFFIKSGGEYNIDLFSDAAAFSRLENDINGGKVKPYFKVKTSKTPGTYFKQINGYLPSTPFYFEQELKYISIQEEKERYNYKKAPKYVIIVRLNKYVKPGSPQSYYVVGCNNDNLYKQISRGRGVVITHTNENIRAVAVYKYQNTYKIVPKQNCLRVALKSKAG